MHHHITQNVLRIIRTCVITVHLRKMHSLSQSVHVYVCDNNKNNNFIHIFFSDFTVTAFINVYILQFYSHICISYFMMVYIIPCCVLAKFPRRFAKSDRVELNSTFGVGGY